MHVNILVVFLDLDMLHLGDAEYPFIAIAPRSTLAVVASDRVLSLGK